MHRTAGFFLSLILLFSLLFLSSCEEEGALSYIDYDGTRYFVSSAVYHIIDSSDGYHRWDVEVGTGDMAYITGQNPWSGSGLLLTAEMYYNGSDFNDVYMTIDSTDPGTLIGLAITPDYSNGDGTEIYSRWDEVQNKVTVSETGGLFVVDFFVMMDDPLGSDEGQPLTGRFIGSMTDLGTEYVIGPNPEE